MKRLPIFIAGIVLAVLAACTTTPTTPAQTIYQVESNYAAALTVAVAYKNLPPCGQAAAPLLCSRADVVRKLQLADEVAYPALQAAQNTARSPGAGANAQTAVLAAQQAVAALTAITATLEVPR